MTGKARRHEGAQGAQFSRLISSEDAIVSLQKKNSAFYSQAGHTKFFENSLVPSSSQNVSEVLLRI